MKVKIRSPIEFEEEPKIYPRVKDIIQLLSAGSSLAAIFVFPALALSHRSSYKKAWSEKDWYKFNLFRLRNELKRLRKQKDVKVEIENGLPVVKLTKRGKRKALKYKLEEMGLDEKNWDGKWRLIVYDIPKSKSKVRNTFRHMLKRMKLYQLQKSVYLTPFKCTDEIEFLRELHDLGEDVQIIIATGLENEKVYRRYFGI